MKRKEVINRLKEILEQKFVSVSDEYILNQYKNLRDWLAIDGTPLKLITEIKDYGINCYGSLMLQIVLETYDDFDFACVEYSILI